MNKHLVAALFLFSLSPVSAAPGDEAIDLAKAPERGVFNIGPARGDIRPFSDPKIGKEVLEFHYEAPAGSVVGVWSKGYPAPSDPARAAVARIRVRSSETPQGTVHVELKGSRDVQTIPVPVKAAWTSGDETVDWEKIGELKEIVFVVTPPENRSASGTLYLDIHLAPKPPSQGKQAVPAAFTLHDAEENGVFTMGASQGTLEPAADPVTGRRAMKFDYRAPRGSAVGLWTKSYPASLSKSSVNSVKIGVRPIRPDQAGKVTVTVELKGTRVTQSVPVPLQSGHSLVEERLDWSKIGELKEVVFVVSPLGEKTAAGTLFLEAEFLKIVVPRTTAAVGTPTSFNLLGAQESGVFNMGESEGKTKTVFDPSLRKEVLELAYVAPADSAVGVWTKNFPASLGPATANAVQIDVWAEPGKERSAAVTLEIKGSRVTQSLPVELGPGWISSQKIVNWDMVGDLKEVVFVVTPKDGAASGTLRFNLDFLHLTSLPNPPPAPASPLGGKLILLAGLSLLLTAGATVLKRRRPAGGAEAVSVPKETRSSFFSEIKRDLAFGAVVVLLLSAALYIHTVAPSAGPADLGFLAVAFAGVLATEMLKYLLTGRHLTPVEVLQNFFFSGLLAVSSSHQALWHAPGHWTEIVQKSRLTASLTFLIYHAVNASILASAGNHLRLSAGSLLVGAP
jgi:cyclic beta-1,2-glucan synthetase